MFFQDFLQFPFLQRAVVASVLIAPMLAGLGVFVTLRGMALFGEGIAHASLAGIAIAVLAGVAPLPIAIAWAVLVALALFWFERKTRLSSDTLIGIAFTASMALGVVLMSMTKGYQPELMTYLFGNVLAIGMMDVYAIAALFVMMGLWLWRVFRPLTFLSLSEETAAVSGIRTQWHTLALYVMLAIATVLGVKILGIILISALLIIPPATSRLITGSFKSYFFAAIVLSEIAVLAGLFISYQFNLPSGASIVLVSTALFFFGLIFKRRI